MNKGLVYILLFLSGWLSGQSIELLLDTNEILIGEQTIVTINASSGQKLHWHSFEQENGRFKNWIDQVEIVEVSDIDTLFDSKLPNYVQRITVTAFDTGYFVIPPIKMSQLSGDTLTSNPLLLTVKYPDFGQEQQPQLADIKGQEDKPFIWQELIQYWWIIALIVGLVLILVIINYFLQKRKQKPKAEVKKPKVPAHVVALKKLQELEGKKLWQKGDFKTYYSEISYILRWYLEERFDTAVLEFTTHEIMIRLQNRLSNQDLENVEWVLRETDLAKYAKSTPIEADNVKVLEETRKLIESTKKEEEQQ